MSPLLATGIVTIFLALFAYTAGVVVIVRGRRITRRAAASLTLGLALDTTATGCMAALSSGPPTYCGWRPSSWAWRRARPAGDLIDTDFREPIRWVVLNTGQSQRCGFDYP